MKTLFLILALAVSPQSRLSLSDLGLAHDYDRFRDETNVRLVESLMPDRPGYVLLNVFKVVKGRDPKLIRPTTAMLAITSQTDEWYFHKTQNTLLVIQDGKRYEIGNMKRIDSEVTHSGVREILLIEVPFATIERLSQGSEIEIQVGRYEAKLNPSVVQNIKAWVSQFN